METIAKAVSDAASRGRLLLVEDEPALRRSLGRALSGAGFAVQVAADGGEAVGRLRRGSYDVVISNIAMPGTGGIELLRFVRISDPDLPVILVTGDPTVETAVQALDHGAFRYLAKPVDPEELIAVIQSAIHIARMARIRREALALTHATASPELSADFEAALDTLWMAFQPIVTKDGALYGHEALMRLRHERVPHPGAMLDAAEKLDALPRLGRRLRRLSARAAADDPASGALFVNLHPRDLLDEDLLSADATLTQLAPRVVLEVTERQTVGDIPDLRLRVEQLKDLGFRIAIDDLGAGYAGLTSFALLEPDIVKLDMSLVRDVDRSPMKQRLVASIATLCRDMDILVIGEGVETRAERDALVELGCDLLQGYHIAKPAEPFPSYAW